jgi:hypothetical protein
LLLDLADVKIYRVEFGPARTIRADQNATAVEPGVGRHKIGIRREDRLQGNLWVKRLICHYETVVAHMHALKSKLLVKRMGRGDLSRSNTMGRGPKPHNRARIEFQLLRVCPEQYHKANPRLNRRNLKRPIADNQRSPAK